MEFRCDRADFRWLEGSKNAPKSKLLVFNQLDSPHGTATHGAGDLDLHRTTNTLGAQYSPVQPGTTQYCPYQPSTVQPVQPMGGGNLLENKGMAYGIVANAG